MKRVALVTLELVTGGAALVCGLLLVARPDGSLLQAETSALAGSPFPDYRVPGLLLAALVGVGFLTMAAWLWSRRRGAWLLSLLGGLGLVVFELAEVLWLGFQPLEAVFMAVGLVVVLLAWRLEEQPRLHN